MKLFVVGAWIASFTLLGAGGAVAQQGGGKVAYVNTQAILKQNLGVDSTIKAVERAVLNDEQRSGNWHLSLNTIGMPLYDPTLGWFDYFSTGAANNLIAELATR